MGVYGVDSFFLTPNLMLLWSLVYKNWDGAHLLSNLGLILSSAPLVLFITAGPALICCVMGRGPEKLEEI